MTSLLLALPQLVFVLLLGTNFPEAHRCQSHSQKDEMSIDKIVIKSVSFRVTTWGRVNCDLFDKQFPNANTTLVIERSILDEFSRRISKLKPPIKGYAVDTRARIVIHYSNGKQGIMCIDGGKNLVFNGNLFKYEKSISSLLGISTQ